VTLAEHAASIAHDHRDHPDRLTVWRYANLAAKWSLLRLQRYRKETGDAEERQFATLTPLVRDLTTALGLGTCIDATKTEATIGTRSSAISTCIPALRRVRAIYRETRHTSWSRPGRRP
jgi:hypothetical protein